MAYEYWTEPYMIPPSDRMYAKVTVEFEGSTTSIEGELFSSVIDDRNKLTLQFCGETIYRFEPEDASITEEGYWL